MHELQSSSIEADIARLEAGIRQLKVQYDMFFAGALPREPYELRSELERLIRRNSNIPIRKYAHRFHFNSLVSRYNSFLELWGKTLRAREEGDRPPSQTAAQRSAGEQVVASCRIDGDDDDGALRSLHARFVEARRRADAKAADLPYDTFARGIAKQAARLREKSGAPGVELRLVVDQGKVQLKARPSKS